MKILFVKLLCAVLCLSMLASCQQPAPSESEDVTSSADATVSEQEPVSSEATSETDTSSTSTTTPETDYNEAAMITYERKEVPEGKTHRKAKIMTFGDSLTSGSGTTGGYRYYLFEKLYRAGAYFEFVGGSQQKFYNLPDAYTRMVAVGGKKASDAIDMWSSSYQADIVLAMFGANDRYGNRTPEEILADYTKWLDKAYADNPDLIVYIASIPELETCFKELNPHLPKFCEDYAAKSGKEVYYVEMNGIHKLDRSVDSQSASDMHPNNLGNEKMAASFYDAIVNRVLELNDEFVDGTDTDVAVTGVTIEQQNNTLALNEQLSLRFTVAPAEATVKTVFWFSSNPEIATVDVYGIVTPKAVGETTITLTSLDGAKTATTKITVTEKKELLIDSYQNLVFDSDFSTTENWTGDTDLIKTASAYAYAAWIGDAKTITSAKDIDFGKSFRISFRYAVDGGEEATSDSNYSAFMFGDYRLMISRCAGKVQLDKKNEQGGYSNILGSYQYHSIVKRYDDYDIVYDNGTFSVFRNNELLFTAKDDAGSLKATLSFKWSESWHRATCNYIKVYTAA